MQILRIVLIFIVMNCWLNFEWAMKKIYHQPSSSGCRAVLLYKFDIIWLHHILFHWVWLINKGSSLLSRWINSVHCFVLFRYLVMELLCNYLSLSAKFLGTTPLIVYESWLIAWENETNQLNVGYVLYDYGVLLRWNGSKCNVNFKIRSKNLYLKQTHRSLYRTWQLLRHKRHRYMLVRLEKLSS